MIMLQWGRNFIVAETCPPAACANPRRRGFNGAATLSLRKPVIAVGRDVEFGRFNGAATLSLRKHSGRNRGITSIFMLQWGRNFIVAETSRPSSMSCSVVSLQWGRNFIVAETAAVVDADGVGTEASMGPQLYRCGNEHPQDGAHLHYGASMGPQLYRCGNIHRISRAVVSGDRLQWGRNFIVAETQTRWTRLASGGPLQWGRNFIVAETNGFVLSGQIV